MAFWVWVAVVTLIAVFFFAISGEAIVALILTAFWVGAIWLLVTYGGSLMDAIWPPILIVLGLVVLSVASLAVLANALEERRWRKDRGRAAPPRWPRG